MRNEKRFWTKAEEHLLLSLIKKKKPISEIAEKLGRTEKSVRRKCETQKISSATTYKKRRKI